MKTAGKILLWFLIPIVATVAFFVVLIYGTFALAYIGDELLYPKFRAEWMYSGNEEEFNTVLQYINETDFSEYKAEPNDPMSIMIFRPETLPTTKQYEKYVSNQSIHEDVLITDKGVNLALDRMFRHLHLDYIAQTRNVETRCIYFGFTYSVGIVYSPSGEEPEGQPDDQDYSFKRINDNWFYWTSYWPD
ncbi:MAG: hypothetical protein ABFC31_13555 [Clostridiaceae bacterium]